MEPDILNRLVASIVSAHDRRDLERLLVLMRASAAYIDGMIALQGLETAPPDPSFLVLLDHGPKKISVIRELRGAVGMGLKDAKRIVESAPVVLASVADPHFNKLRESLHAAGALLGIRYPNEADKESLCSYDGLWASRIIWDCLRPGDRE